MTAAENVADRLAHFMSVRDEVLEAYLFGSTARGEEQAHSDVDVAVYVAREKLPRAPFGYAAALVGALIEALATDDVDLVVLNEASPLLYARVLRDGVRVFSRDLRATTRREGEALSRYCDFVPQLAKIEAAHRPRVARGELGR